MLDQVHNAFEKMASAFKVAEEKARKTVLVASSLVPTATSADMEEIAGHLMYLEEDRLDKIVSKVKSNGRLSSLTANAVDEMAKNVQRKIVWKDEDTNKNQGGADGDAKSSA